MNEANTFEDRSFRDDMLAMFDKHGVVIAGICVLKTETNPRLIKVGAAMRVKMYMLGKVKIENLGAEQTFVTKMMDLFSKLLERAGIANNRVM